MIRTLLIQGGIVAAARTSEAPLTEAERRAWLLGPDAPEAAEPPPGELVEITGALAETPIGAGWRRVGNGLEPPPAPPPPRRISPREFLGRLTMAQKIAIRTAAQSNAALAVWIDELLASIEVDLDHPDTVRGLDAMVAAKLLTEEDMRHIRGSV